MQRKKIEAIPPIEAPKGRHNKIYKAAVQIKNIGNERVMLMDIYRSKLPKEPLMRVALTKNDFGNYNFTLKKWDKKRFETCAIYFTGYIESLDEDNCYVTEEDNEKIDKFTKKHNQYYSRSFMTRIRAMQMDISYEKQAKTRANRIDKLNMRCKHMPPMPDDYEEWLLDSYLNTHYMFYKRKGNKVQIKCSNCNNKYEYRTRATTGGFEESLESWGIIPQHNARGRCSKCDCNAIFKAEGMQLGMENKKNTYIIQKYLDDENSGLVVRFFHNTKRSMVREMEATEAIAVTEIARAFIIPGKKVQIDYHKHDPWNDEDFWDDCNLTGMSNIKIEVGVIYPGSYEELGSSLYKYCALKEYMNDYDNVNAISYFRTYENLPALEMIVKSGMRYLATELIENHGFSDRIDRNATRIEELLKVRKEDIKALINERGRLSYLQVLQFEREADIKLTESERDYLEEMMPNYRDLVRVTPYVSVKQIIHRTERYSGISADDIGELPTCVIGALRNTARTYIDYLVMLLEEGYDMTNTVNLHPRDLDAAHQKLVVERNKHILEKEMLEKSLKYPNIKKAYRSLLKEYKYESDIYKVRPARSAEEIIIEGKTLHHCVGGDGYLSKHNNQQSIILFLRHKKQEKTPFATIELDVKKKTIIQWYGLNNKKTSEEKEINIFLAEYLKQLKDKVA